jgi:hypothetical protein
MVMEYREKFSLRQRKLKGLASDVYVYDQVPRPLRVQICHVLTRCLGAQRADYRGLNPAYVNLQQIIAEELGVFRIGLGIRGDDAEIMEFLANDATDDQALDIIEIAVSFAFEKHRNDQYGNWRKDYGVTEQVNGALETINRRFLEHQVGYTFVVDGLPQLIRRDNEYLHQSAILPAMQLLHDGHFEGANEEFRKAHEHYRKGNHKECLNDCLKAFESVLKTICKRKKWAYKPTDTASTLIDICLTGGLFPVFLQSHLGAIKGALTTAIPTARNKLGGHGQGEQSVEVPEYYAEFLLNETATTIVFLVNAYKALP